MFLPETRFRQWIPRPHAPSVQWEQNFDHRVAVRVLRCARGPVVCQLLRKRGERQEQTVNISGLSVWTSETCRAFNRPYRCLWLHNEVIIIAGWCLGCSHYLTRRAGCWSFLIELLAITWHFMHFIPSCLPNVLKNFKHILAVYCHPVPLGDIEFSKMLMTLLVSDSSNASSSESASDWGSDVNLFL